MINLLLVAPQTNQSQGGMTVWTEAFLSQCSKSEINCDLLNIAMIGSRAVKGNNKRNFGDEFVRTKAIFKNLKQMLNTQAYHAAHMNTSCGTFGLIRDYLIVRKIRKKQPKCKCIVHFHCDVKNHTRSKYQRFFLKKLLNITDETLVLNESNVAFLSENCSTGVTAVPNFIDESFVRRHQKAISDDIEHALFVGFVQPEKGAREIYELAARFPTITFDLVGDVRADVKAWERPGNVVLHGPKDRREVIEFLDKADVFVFPTHSEGFSIALLESMSRGLPCITTPAGANAEMLEGKGGLIVPIGDVESMARAIDALRDPERRKEMSRWNLEKVEKFYIVDIVMKRIVNLYR